MAGFAFILRLFSNTVSPSITKLVSTAKNPVPVLRAMGTTFKSITEGTFNSVGSSYRPKPWAPKRDGSPSNLQKSTTMAKSFALEVTSTYAKLSNPMKYAAIHQFGGTIKPVNAKVLRFKLPSGQWVSVKQVTIPARPFFPILNDRLTPAAEEKILRAGKRVIDQQAGSA
jgi:phage gpG-like protein